MKSNHSFGRSYSIGGQKPVLKKSQEELEIATRVYLRDIQFNEFKVGGFFWADYVEYAKPDYSNTFPSW